MSACCRQVTAAPVEPIVRLLAKEQKEVDAANDIKGTKIRVVRIAAIFFIFSWRIYLINKTVEGEAL